MVDFLKTLERAAHLQKIQKRKRESLKKTENLLAKKMASITEICKPACFKAIEKFNATGIGPQIVPKSLELSFNVGERKIILRVAMQWRSGKEMDEDLDSDDIKRFNEALRSLIDQELEEIAVPLTFGVLRVPTEYFIK